MADNVSITAGSGTTIAADDIGGGVLVQRVKAVLGADGIGVDPSAGSGVNGTGVQRVTIATDDVALALLHTDLIAGNSQLPTVLGTQAAAASLGVTASTEDVARIGIITETAPASDTASSGLNGRLQRIAQNITTWISKFTTTAVSDTSRLPVSQLDGQQLTGTFSAAIPTATVTITNASPGVVTWTTHARSVNDAILLTTGGTLPTPLVAGNTVYVKTILDANTFTISLTPGGAAINTSSAGSGTHTGTASVMLTQLMDGYTGISVQATVWGSGTIQYEQSEDYTTWLSAVVIGSSSVSAGAAGALGATSSNAAGTVYHQKTSKVFRVRMSTYTSGTNTVLSTAMQSTPKSVGIYGVGNGLPVVGFTGDSSNSTQAPVTAAGTTSTANRAALATGKVVYLITDAVGKLIVRPNSIPEEEWVYAAATGGISNTTTAVTVKTAAGAGIRNYVTGMQISSDALGAATEFAIRDGAAGTVLFRMKIGTAGILSYHIGFTTPLKGTANTLLEVVTLTASVTGGVFANLQGYQAP